MRGPAQSYSRNRQARARTSLRRRLLVVQPRGVITRETWNRQPGEVCCHICPKSGGRMHSADCKNFGEIVLPRWSDDESYSTSYSYEYASDEEKRRSRKQDATQNRASEKLWKYGSDFVKKRIRGNGSSTFSSLSCFVFLKYFCSSHTHTHSTFHPRN